jgi:hypothetical protein
MRVLKGQTIENDVVDMDDTYLVNCKLKNCELFYSGKEFAWKNTQFDSCPVRLLGSARNTQSLLKSLGLLKAAATPKEIKGDATGTVH